MRAYKYLQINDSTAVIAVLKISTCTTHVHIVGDSAFWLQMEVSEPHKHHAACAFFLFFFGLCADEVIMCPLCPLVCPRRNKCPAITPCLPPTASRPHTYIGT